MKLPIRCPFCNDVMQTDYQLRQSVVTKKCYKGLEHDIFFGAAVKNDEVYDITFRIGTEPLKFITWLLLEKKTFIYYKDKNSTLVGLPYFEPDLSDYKKLVEKVKTYLVFS